MTYKIETYPLGIYAANCYVITEGQHALIIDPGGKGKTLVSKLKEENICVDAILLTHGHFDHIGGVSYMQEQFSCPVYVEEEDVKLLKDTHLNCSMVGREATVSKDIRTFDIGSNVIGTFTCEVIYTPGHTDGCVLLQFDEHLFSGDVLFKNSIGRTDLPTGSQSKMINTLKIIKNLEPSLHIYPGHGERTTIQEELLANPYLLSI